MVGFVFDPSRELFQVARLISRQNAVRAAASFMCRGFRYCLPFITAAGQAEHRSAFIAEIATEFRRIQTED